MVLYGHAGSRAFRCLWLLEEMGLQYELIKVDLKKREQFSEEFIHLNPFSKVPVLKDEDFVLYDSLAICEYLALKHPESGFLPHQSLQETALYRQWVCTLLSSLEEGIWNMAKHKFVFPQEKRIPQMVDVGAYEFGQCLKVIRKEIGDREFILGDKLTIADILFVHMLAWAQHFGLPLIFSNIEAYFHRHSQRSAYQKVLTL